MKFKKYSPLQLRNAIEIEMKKTDDAKMASIIAIKKLNKNPDHYENMEKAKDTSKLVKKVITNKRGKQQTVYVKVEKDTKKSESWLAKLSNIFGFKDRKQTMKKIEKDYKDNDLDKKYGLTWDGWKDHLAEYFNNKEKWTKFFNKEKGEKKSKKDEKTPVKKDKKDKKKSPLKLSVIKFIHGLYGGEIKKEEKDVKKAEGRSEEFFKSESTENPLQKWKSGNLENVIGQTFKYQDIMGNLKGETTFIDEIIIITDATNEYISYSSIDKDGKPDRMAGGGMFTKKAFIEQLNNASLKSTAFSEEPTEKEIEKAKKEIEKKENEKTKNEEQEDNFDTMPEPEENETLTSKGKNGSKVKRDRKKSESEKKKIKLEADEELRENYFNEKPSEILNIGKDVLGAKRHSFTTYEKLDVSLEELEKDGVASGYVTKKNLIGDFGLENKDERVANGETEYKVLGSFLVRSYLTKGPKDSSEERKKYMEFVRSIIRFDNETNSMDDFVSGLGQSIKNIFNITEEDENDIIKDNEKWYSSKKSDKIKEISETIGEPLAYFLIPFVLGSETKARFFDNLSYKISKKSDRKEFNILGSVFFNETLKRESYDQLKVRALGATKAAGVKIKKGDTVKINDKMKEKIYIISFKVPEGREKYHEEKNKELYDINKDYGMMSISSSYLGVSKKERLKQLNEKYFKNKISYLPTTSDMMQFLRRKYTNIKEELSNELIREKLYPENNGEVVKAGKNGIHVAFNFPGGKIRTFNVNPADLDNESVESVKKKAIKTKTVKADFYIEKEVKRKGGKNFDKMSISQMQKILNDNIQMKALQYGNSMPDTEREYHTRKTLEAMSDLSELLGLPLEQISARGKLGIAFGARGRAGALAHYEPSTKMINLTRSNGFGSLAHEFGHFIDNILSNKMSGFISDERIYDNKTVHIDNMPHGAIYIYKRGNKETKYFYDADEPTKYKWKKLNKGQTKPSENQSGVSFYNETFTVEVPSKVKFQNAQDIAKKSIESLHKQCDEKIEAAKKIGDSASVITYQYLKQSKYYNTPTEAFARAFECYIADKLEDNGRKNTYLASKEKTYKKDGLVMYPQDKYRKEIEKLFDSFFKDISETNELKKAIKALFNNKIIKFRKI